MEEGKVSVIIPTYNRSRWLPDAIESILIQTYDNIEIIVVNDGSTDDTEKILEPYRDRIRYIYKENGGPGAAVNKGISVSTGQYIARLDDDDLFLPEKLESQVKMFCENPEFGLVASDTHIMDSEGHITYTRELPDFSKHGAFLTLLQYCMFVQPTVMVRKACHDKVGLYKSKYAQDYDMWIRISRYYPVGAIHRPLAVYRRHGGNRSGKSSGSKVRPDIQSFITEMLDSLTMEELFGKNYSETYAHDVIGAIFMKHTLFQRAGIEFRSAVKAEPNNLIHFFWSGILLRRIGHYENAYGCFKSIPSGNWLYEDAKNAIELTLRFESMEKEADENNARPELDEDDEALTQFRQDVSKEYNKLMDITISLAKGQLQ
jgi:glycosyltransferase involved in cell wall biosynthesis